MEDTSSNIQQRPINSGNPPLMIPTAISHPKSDTCGRKKRSKLAKYGQTHQNHHQVGRGTNLEENNSSTTTTATPSSAGNYRKKPPDPATATMITRPCSECGKRFWSWKALFGHMRCHPEHQRRGINPPSNILRTTTPNTTLASKRFSLATASAKPVELTNEDHEVAQCLVMLANRSRMKYSPLRLSLGIGTDQHSLPKSGDSVEPQAACDSIVDASLRSRFECSSCKRVFGSHQALGGHRASHKNVKGCFTIANDQEEEEEEGEQGFDDEEGKVNVGNQMLMLSFGHKCNVCLRVFSTGQALGGHKRCHWGGEENPSLINRINNHPCALDLNLPAPLENQDGCSSHHDLVLDLTLGI